jgi:hypothetical protein
VKPVSQITDRAKRLRANKVHKLKKRCEECNSKRNLGVGHRDGDESNNRPSNLFTQCKSCNGKQTARDIKAGRGVRTRQYNPDKIAGHEGWKQLMASKLAAKYDGLRKSGMSRDAAMTETLRSTTAGPGSVALFKKLAKNPGATNLAQYVQAAVEHTRGSHDAGGKVIHETPKSKRREFAREIAFRKGHRNPARRNPESEADKLYRKFHGRGPDRIYEMQVRGVDPYGGHAELTSLGPLIRFIVGEGVELGGQFGDEVKEADWVREISFVPSVSRWHDWLERSNPPLPEIKQRLREYACPDLAAVPNTKQLYILGQQTGENARALLEISSDSQKDVHDLGNVYLVEYFAQKRFDQFEPIGYFHHFSELSHDAWPRLIFDSVHGILSLAGGRYEVKAAGITN